MRHEVKEMECRKNYKSPRNRERGLERGVEEGRVRRWRVRKLERVRNTENEKKEREAEKRDT